MNLDQLRKNLGHLMRLRPLPIRRGPKAEQLESIDDPWRLEAILPSPTRVRLSNIRTHHFVELQSDNVRSFQSPDFLLLRCQLTISARGIDIEPILDGGGKR